MKPHSLTKPIELSFAVDLQIRTELSRIEAALLRILREAQTATEEQYPGHSRLRRNALKLVRQAESLRAELERWGK